MLEPTTPGESSPMPPGSGGELSRLRARVAELEGAARRDRLALQVSQMGTWSRDSATGLVEWSPELIAVFGLTEETFPRTHEAFMELVHPDEQAHFLQVLEKAVRERTVYDLDFRYRHASGEYRWMNGRGRGFYATDGTLVELAGVGVDITAQKRAEHALQERELQLRQIGDNLPQGAIYQLELGPNGQPRFVYWSAGIERLIGVSAQEALADPLKLYGQIHPEDVAAMIAAERRSLEGKLVFDQTVRLQHRATGEWRWVHLRSAPRRVADGRQVWDGIYLDVTAAREVEEALAASMERLELAQKAGHVGVFDWDVPSGRVIWSPVLEQIFGLEPGTFEGHFSDWERRITPADRERLEAETRAAMREHRPEISFAFRILRADGAVRFVEGAARLLYGAEGEPRRVVGVNLDVTTLRESERALQEGDRRKNEFLAMLAHELRNPLAAIRHALQLCDEAPEDGEVFGWARAVLGRQSRQLARLVDDLLDVSRITLGKIELRQEVTSLVSILDHAVESVSPLAKQRHHQLTTVYDAPEQLALRADPARLEQVFVNLLTNAAKFTEPHGRICLTARRLDGKLLVTVSDTGIGIVPERLSEMFELFMQGERSMDRAEGGLGLGLTIVRSLVEMHGGTVQARSDGPGTGSEFIVTLPAAAVPGSASALPGRRQAAGRPRRILVVDDNEDSAHGLARLLKRKGHTVQLAFDGHAGLQMAQELSPEVILLDLGLPGLDGLEVALALREQRSPADLLIVAITGYGQEDDRQRSAAAGCDAHLVKPVDFDKLLELLHR